jgi:hypothetical protein
MIGASRLFLGSDDGKFTFGDTLPCRMSLRETLRTPRKVRLSSLTADLLVCRTNQHLRGSPSLPGHTITANLAEAMAHSVANPHPSAREILGINEGHVGRDRNPFEQWNVH